MTLISIKDSFIDAAIKHGEAIENGDYKIANKINKQLKAICATIKERELWYELKDLTKHSNENVRLWSATYLLRYDTVLAKVILEEIRMSKKIFGTSAKIILNMWDKGMLTDI